jgi:NAD-dependent dihydropyrimidine dehydrogenase PreA subunit
MKGFTYLQDVATLQLDTEACAGCGACEEVCPHQVFALRGGKAEIIDLDRCMECGACQTNCQAGAIRVDVGVGCAAGLISEWLDEVIPRRPGSKRCC